MKYIAVLMLLFILLINPTISAQQTTILTVTMPRLGVDFIPEDLIAQFEASHPNTHVTIVQVDPALMLPVVMAEDYNDYLANVRYYAKHADVLLVTDTVVTMPTVEARFFLDISPMTMADDTINEINFHPLATEAFSWDGGTWALATTINLELLLFDQQRFDTHTLSYPTPDWQLSDYEFAAQVLQESPTEASLETYHPGVFVRSLYGEPLYDAEYDVTQPQFTDPDLAQMVALWRDLETRNLFTHSLELGDRSRPPMMLANVTSLEVYDHFSASLLPNNQAGLSAAGYAISAATTQPELAYELVAFLAEHQENFPVTGLSTSINHLQQQLADYSPDTQTIINQGLSNPISLPDIYYARYVDQALEEYENDPQFALDNQQAKINLIMAAANVMQGDGALVMMPPPPEPNTDSGGITLRFGIQPDLPYINRQGWQGLTDDFVASEPLVDDVIFVSPMRGTSVKLLSEESDCFFFPTNKASILRETGLILSLDPLINADPSFDIQDIIGDSLASVQINHKTMALPITIAPQVLRYDTDLIAQTGVNPQGNTWTTNEFELILRTLPEILSEDTPPFLLQHATPSDKYILMLIASYGGLPFDYRTDPPTINFTEQETMNAIRQVLDLAKDGLIDYQALSSRTQYFNTVISPIYTFNSGGSLFAANGYGVSVDSADGWVSFPHGQDYLPYSFELGTGYISSQTFYPEICYRWLRAASQQPNLFFGLPAYKSLLDSPAITPEGRVYMNEFITLSEKDNAILFSQSESIWHNLVELDWLYQIFDNYVLRDGDLGNELAIAQENIIAMRACVEQVPMFDVNASEEEIKTYYRNASKCAIDIDPALGSFFHFE